MWTPADITAIPTQNDIVLANQALKSIEEELEHALIALAAAQRRVTDLEKDLVRRRAWIAPIRQLKLDVLSLIFEFCGEDEWRTPLRILEVSREWRSLVLATPRAWAFLDLKEVYREHHIIGLFFQRSGQCPLHIFLPDFISTPLLCNMETRLKCLSILDVNGIPEDAVFQVLDRLIIRSVHTYMEIFYFNDTRFPSLRHLVCKSFLTSSREDSPGVPSWTFPPLQTLSLILTDDLAWASLLHACSETLISLEVHLWSHSSLQPPRILLPGLRRLEIVYWNEAPGIWSLDLKSPVLEIYLEFAGEIPNFAPHHRDTATVKQMCLDYTPSLASFPLLERLLLEQQSHVSAVISQLALHNTLSPKLQEVVAWCIEGLTHDLEKEMEKVNQHRPLPIKLVSTRYLPKDLPYAITTTSPCGKNMPCSDYF